MVRRTGTAVVVIRGCPRTVVSRGPERDIVVEIEGRNPTAEASSASGSAYRLYPVRATLSLADQRLTMAGVRIEDTGP